MKTKPVQKAFLILTLFLLLGLASLAQADGNDTLGETTITIVQGTDLLAAGTGLHAQPGTISLDVPAPVRQALLYWEGQSGSPFTPVDTLIVNGVSVQGMLIGMVEFGSGPLRAEAYRADITALGLVTQGPNQLTISGLDFTESNDGAGLFVIVDDGNASKANIQVRDGVDYAYFQSPPPLDTTTPQTFTFAAAASSRSATLSLFVGGAGSLTKPIRPTVIEVTVAGATTRYTNQLNSNDGRLWDTWILPVQIPANANSLTVRILSEDDENTGFQPASLIWVAAGLSLPAPDVGPGETGIRLDKQVSLDGGVTWLETDGTQGDESPAATINMDLLYRLVVRNTGAMALQDVTVSDPNLGITGYLVGDLAIGGEKIITSADIPALSVPDACSIVGNLENTAAVTAQSAEAVMANDLDTVTVACTCVNPDSPLLYQNDFETEAGEQWSNNSTDTAPNGQKFLGQFGNETVRFTLGAQVCPQTLVQVSFDLYIIRSWDGNMAIQPGADKVIGPDVFDLRVDGGPQLYHTTFTNWPQFGGVPFRQAYPGWHPGGDYTGLEGASHVNSLGYMFGPFAQDSVYRLQAQFYYPTNLADPTAPITLDFTGSGLQVLSDESWGIDNFQLNITNTQTTLHFPVIHFQATGFGRR